MRKLLLFVSLLVSFTFTSVAQTSEPQVVETDIIVQLKQGLTADYIIEKVSARVGTPVKAETRLLAESMNAWLISSGSKSEADELRRLFQMDDEVILVQANHILQYRGQVPDDSLFNLQWQMMNTGQNGGLVDADIDADDAWEITTGGMTPRGDTIVVAVIDDGIDVLHNDFGDNIWVNYHEIPNNNIDDDGNGYIDDRRGWNSYDLNDDISGGSWGGWHGTSVAGIVGAQGDNQRGVTGVNWNVKLMIIVGGGNEADAIAAYSYVLENRKLYDSSNGQKGAYIVATNSSWGVDFGQPSQAPLWCAFYDTLGAYGILSAAATSNSNQNIDQVGDLPTACPSDYLISVTNTNRHDQKVNQAGYGATTIDIGAPGEASYTVDHTGFSNGYGAFGGTSGASPHVAGAIALLHSAPCDTFAGLVHSYPDSMALKIKDFILNGSDSLATLNSITVSGGRLNLFNALIELQDYCSLILSVEEAKPGDLTVYPNPATDIVSVELPSGLQNGMLSVIDIQGRVLIQNEISQGTQLVQLALHTLDPGVYIFLLSDAKRAYRTKILLSGR